MKYLHALLARDRENLQENPRALLLLTCKLAEHMLQTIILNTLPQSPRTGTGKSTKIIEKRFVTNSKHRVNAVFTIFALFVKVVQTRHLMYVQIWPKQNKHGICFIFAIHVNIE